MPLPDVKSIPLTEKLIIPPDPAVFLGQAVPGHVFGGSLVDKEEGGKGKGVGGRYVGRGQGASGSRNGTENQQPLLLVVTEEPDDSPSQQRQSTSQEGASGASGDGLR